VYVLVIGVLELMLSGRWAEIGDGVIVALILWKGGIQKLRR